MANATERALRKKRKRDAAAAAAAVAGSSRKAGPFPLRPKKKIVKTRPNRTGKNPNHVPLGGNDVLEAKGLKEKKVTKKEKNGKEIALKAKDETFLLSTLPASRQLHFFLNRFQAAGGFKLSEIELEAIKDTCIVELPEGSNQDVENFSKHVKYSFKDSWKDVLCKRDTIEGKIDAGSPALLIISTSAMRSLELLRGLQSLTRDCRPAKLFAKHMKIEEQATLLKDRVNIATGTPSRIKKLIDSDALGLSRLALVVIDMQRDAKGYSLFTLPQVSNEFWELYRSHFHQKLVEGGLRVCLYGPTSVRDFEKSSIN